MIACGQVLQIGAVADAAVVAAGKNTFAAAVEVDAIFISGTTVALGIDNFDIEHGDVGAIGEKFATWPKYWSELERDGISRGRFLIRGDDGTLVIVAGGLDRAGLPGDVVEGKAVMIDLITLRRGEIVATKAVVFDDGTGGIERLELDLGQYC